MDYNKNMGKSIEKANLKEKGRKGRKLQEGSILSKFFLDIKGKPLNKDKFVDDKTKSFIRYITKQLKGQTQYSRELPEEFKKKVEEIRGKKLSSNAAANYYRNLLANRPKEVEKIRDIFQSDPFWINSLSKALRIAYAESGDPSYRDSCYQSLFNLLINQLKKKVRSNFCRDINIYDDDNDSISNFINCEYNDDEILVEAEYSSGHFFCENEFLNWEPPLIKEDLIKDEDRKKTTAPLLYLLDPGDSSNLNYLL